VRSSLAALLVSWIVVAMAHADALVATPRFVPAAGPVVAGPERVAWVTRRDDRVLDLWVAAPGQAPRRVQRFSGADTERLRAPRLTASSSAVGLELLVTDLRGKALDTLTYAGEFGQPLVRRAALPALATTPLWPGRGVQVARACASAEIRVIALPAPASRIAEPACALRLRRAPRLRGGHLRLGVSCAGFRIACTARVRISSRGRVIAPATARYNHATPPFAAASLRIGPAARRLLRSGARVRVTARIDGLVTRHTIVQLPAARR
jgi:hypothetical protein